MRHPYDLELEKIHQLVLNKHYKKILIQMPEGMLDRPLKEILEVLTPLNVQVIISGDPSYGICDLGIDLAVQLGCELLIHFGHTTFGFEQKIHAKRDKLLDLLTIPAFVTFEISSHFPQILQKIKELKWINIGLVATAQHLMNLHELENFLDDMEINIVIKGEGQILGCHIENIRDLSSNVDGIISLHAGFFHTRGLLLSTSLPILQLDPFTGEIVFFSNEERNKLIRKRHAIISLARSADVWGILGSSKLGQYHPNQSRKAEEMLKDQNKFGVSVVAENLSYQYLANFPWIDAWVDTACPRLAVDDQINFQKPVLTFKEFLYLFNEVTWDQILSTGFF